MRLCGAVGLHHMIYPMFWYTELGGVEVVAGQTDAGGSKNLLCSIGRSKPRRFIY